MVSKNDFLPVYTKAEILGMYCMSECNVQCFHWLSASGILKCGEIHDRLIGEWSWRTVLHEFSYLSSVWLFRWMINNTSPLTCETCLQYEYEYLQELLGGHFVLKMETENNRSVGNTIEICSVLWVERRYTLAMNRRVSLSPQLLQDLRFPSSLENWRPVVW
jgi:hypothetical protein